MKDDCVWKIEYILRLKLFFLCKAGYLSYNPRIYTYCIILSNKELKKRSLIELTQQNGFLVFKFPIYK